MFLVIYSRADSSLYQAVQTVFCESHVECGTSLTQREAVAETVEVVGLTWSVVEAMRRRRLRKRARMACSR